VKIDDRTPYLELAGRRRRARDARAAIVKFKADKVTANAFYLTGATAATSLLGLLFWGLAARTHHSQAFGRAYAEVSVLTLLSVVAQFNLSNIFIRFLPEAGRLSTYFVRRGYLVVTVTALGLGALVIASGAVSSFVAPGLVSHGLFVLAVALFAIFALQDAVLTALRITHWVPIENASFAIVKLGLLIWFVTVLSTRTAIVYAWVLPVGVAVLLVNTLLFARSLPNVSRQEGGALPVRRRLASFVAAEYLNTLCSVAVAALLPLIVIWRLGATHEAYFAIPWLIWGGISTVSWNIATSFVVETVTERAHSARLLRRALVLWLAVVVIAVVACSVVGPTVLGLLNHDYGVHGGPLLRLIGISAPFTFVTVVYTSFAWLDQRVWFMMGIQACMAGVVLGLSLVLIPRLGILGVGWAYFISQVGAAVLMSPGAWVRVRTVLGSPTRVPIGEAGRRQRWSSPRRSPTPRWPEAPGRTIVTAWIGLAVAVCAPALMLAAPEHDVTLAAVLVLAAAGFGPAVTCRLDTGDAVAQLAATVVLSLAAFALAAAGLIWLAWWHPAALAALAVPTVVSCLHRIVTQRGVHPAPAL
jgi:O-antigen/teichoic acid export membrane protein